MAKTTYAVEITTERGREVSRLFVTLVAARKWATWCRTCRGVMASRILAGGPDGMEVA